MESIIKWNTGTPTVEGEYLVVINKEQVLHDYLIVWNDFARGQIAKRSIWRNNDRKNITAWCKISDIKV